MKPPQHGHGHNPQSRERKRRVVLARAVSRLFDSWQLSAAYKLALLGLSAANRAALARYDRGEPLAASRDLLDRAGHLLGIHKSLKLLYPRNPEVVRRWMTSANQKFHGETPVEVVSRFGFPGLVMVRGVLDAMRGR
ncbi:MAG TPA: MbcA/ParS/Xre antitoxin family protein [Acidiferrobacterales bacterium]|nr:MbcA/ParS/Xre antitoxin family protein [Acidiferrobacterales bacterium]